jgi:hypothetical protein
MAVSKTEMKGVIMVILWWRKAMAYNKESGQDFTLSKLVNIVNEYERTGDGG